MKKTISLSVFAVASALVLSASAMAGDAANGEKIFKKKCKTCHVVEAGKKPKATGPNLAGFLTRPSGTSDYKHSKKLAAAAITWNEETLDQWLQNPRKMVKGSRMSFKLKKEKDRQDVIAYLMTIGS
ncbi:c-type cytochrome [Curvivirga aplysinae]|uniref:c-type cytochrome n=1 Tax=Curvivirga aplysinae TaxID=2529852 RepID=UPI0012BBD243|nr:c-type cytochrome [Curvivirga aplysinae]MTI09635.1 c-type cytochrome [Curvivirga aplysinae]